MWWTVQQITALLMMKREPEPPPPPGFWKQRLTFAPFLKERAYDPNFKRAWIQNAPWRKVLSPGKRQDLSTFLLQLLHRKCADSSSPSNLSAWYNFNKTPTNIKEFGSPPSWKHDPIGLRQTSLPFLTSLSHSLDLLLLGLTVSAGNAQLSSHHISLEIFV